MKAIQDHAKSQKATNGSEMLQEKDKVIILSLKKHDFNSRTFFVTSVTIFGYELFIYSCNDFTHDSPPPPPTKLLLGPLSVACGKRTKG